MLESDDLPHAQPPEEGGAQAEPRALNLRAPGHCTAPHPQESLVDTDRSVVMGFTILDMRKTSSFSHYLVNDSQYTLCRAE